MWTQGPGRRDCAPWEVKRKETPLPNFTWCSKMMDSHFSPETATTLDFSHSTTTSGDGSIGEGTRRLHGSYWKPSSPWRQTTGVDCKSWEFCCLPSLISYALWSCIWWRKVLLPPSTGSISGCHHNVKMFCFNMHFVVLVSERNLKYI